MGPYMWGSEMQNNDYISRKALLDALLLFTPDQVGYPANPGIVHARSLIEAAPAVDAVALPCSYGRSVWVVGPERIMECSVTEISFGVAGLFYLLDFDCDSDCAGCPFNSWKQDYLSGEWFCDGECGQTSISGSAFGETAFLTREEAEAALADNRRLLELLQHKGD